MFLDCLHYQVDLIGGDANVALYRAAGRNQESIDIRGGMYQSTLDYFVEALTESPCQCATLGCSIFRQTASVFSQSTKTNLVVPMRIARRPVEIRFLVWIHLSPPSWSGDIQWTMINGLKHLRVGWNTRSASQLP